MELLEGLLPIALILVVVAYFIFRKRIKSSAKATRALNWAAGIILLGGIILVNVGDDGAFRNFYSDDSIEDIIGATLLGAFIILLVYLYRRSRRRP